MDGRTITTLAEYIVEQRRKYRDNNGASQQPAFDTTTEDDAHWDQGDTSGDGGCHQHTPR